MQGNPGRPSLEPLRIERYQLLPVGIYRSSKNGRKYRIRLLWVEFLQNGLSEVHEIVHACRGLSVHKCAGYDATSCSQWAAQCNEILHTGPLRANSRFIRPLFNVESPNFTMISMPAYSTSTPDMTSSATSGLHFSKFEVNVDDAAS